jgi:hypothetical protein
VSLRTKRRIYTSQQLLSVTGISPSVSTGIAMAHHLAPHSTQETFLRGRMEAHAQVAVNAPGFDIPPEFWWVQTRITAAMFWVPSNSATLQPLDGSSVDYLGSVELYPSRHAIETNAGEYAIIWDTRYPLVTQTARKSAIATTGPGIMFQLHFYDPQFVFSNFWTDVSINLFSRHFSLWEDPP